MKPIELEGCRFGELTVIGFHGRHYDGARRWLCRCDCGGFALRTTGALRDAERRGHVPSCRNCRLEVDAGRAIDRRAARARERRAWWELYRDLYAPSHVAGEIAALREALGVDEPIEPGWIVEEPADLGRSRGSDLAMTLEEIAIELGCTRERVRQIEAQAIRKLRVALDRLLRDEPPTLPAKPDWMFTLPVKPGWIDVDAALVRAAAWKKHRAILEAIRLFA